MNSNEEEKQFRNEFNQIMSQGKIKSILEQGPVRPEEELETVVKELLQNAQQIDASDISVNTEGSMVFLSGTVKSQWERDEVLSIVGLIDGISEVRADLIVKTHGGILPTDVGRDSR